MQSDIHKLGFISIPAEADKKELQEKDSKTMIAILPDPLLSNFSLCYFCEEVKFLFVLIISLTFPKAPFPSPQGHMTLNGVCLKDPASLFPEILI